MAGDVTEADVIAALRTRYAPPAFGFLSHVPTGTGSRAERTIDGVAMSLWPSRGYRLIGFEIKVSRSDWLRELKMPAKAEAAFACVDQWYVVTPDSGVIGPGERPAGWGWLTLKAGRLHVAAEAAERDKYAPITRHFLAALFRKIVANGITTDRLQADVERAVERGKIAGRDEAVPGYERLRVVHEGVLQKVRAFEEASGLTIIGGYQDVGRIASAVRALVSEYDSTRERLVTELNCLTRVAESVGRAISELDRYHDDAARTDRRVPEGPRDADCSADPGV